MHHDNVKDMTEKPTLVEAAVIKGLTNNPLGKWESEKEQEEEHNYEYVDENVIENIRKVFQDTTTRNKDILSEDRRDI